MELKQVYAAPDGTTFDTKKEAMTYMRRPKILEALGELTNGNDELNEWLVENQESVEGAFEVGTIKRVTKSEHKKLSKALDEIVEAGNPKFAFVADNADAIRDSFRWPSVKRMNDEEKAVASKNTLMGLTENNEELSDWIVNSRDKILEAYQAGVEKRKVNPKAAEALAAYRAKKAEEKAAAEAAAE